MIAVQTKPNAASSVPWPLAQRSNIATDTGCADGEARITASERSRAATRKMKSQPASNAGVASGTMMRRSTVRNGLPAIDRGFLQLRINLQNARRRVAHAVGQKADGESENEGPQRAVDRDRHREIDLDHGDAEHDAGKDQRRGGELVEQPAPGRRRTASQPATTVSAMTQVAAPALINSVCHTRSI